MIFKIKIQTCMSLWVYIYHWCLLVEDCNCQSRVTAKPFFHIQHINITTYHQEKKGTQSDKNKLRRMESAWQ